MSGASSGAATGATVGTAVSPGVGSLLGAAAGGLLGLAADTWSSDRSREMDQVDYQENQLQNFMYGQQSQRNAASNEVAGLMKAGLNPALAGGANAAPMVGAPMQNKQAPQLNVGMAQLLSGLALQKAQKENVEADTELKGAQKEKVEGESQLNSEQLAQYKEYRQSYASNLTRMYREFAKDDYHFDKSTREAFEFAADELEKDSSEGISAGGMKAMFDYLETRERLLKQVSKEVAASFDFETALASMDPAIVKATASMPVAQRTNLLSLSAQYMENVKLMATSEKLNTKELERVDADVNRIITETKKIYHSDNLQLIDDKQAAKVLWNVGGSAANALLRAKH